MRRPTPADGLFIALMCWTAAVSAYVVRIEFFGKPATAQPRQAAYVADWRDLRRAGFVMGEPDAAKSVVVFSDYQCPYCRAFAAVVDSLRERHPDVLVVERHFPIVELHDAAFDAALAAECARDVGRYGEMRAVLFQHRDLVGDDQWGKLARLAGVRDTARLSACVRERRHADHVNADLAVGHKLGIEGTPSVLVNDSLINGTMSLVALEHRLGY